MTAPTYNHLHGGHDRTDPRYATTGHDVIHTETFPDGKIRVTVVKFVPGAANYLTALDEAKSFRLPAHVQGTPLHWGYTAERFACGCRWIATSLETERDNIEFNDLQEASA